MATLRPVPQTPERAIALVRVSKERDGMLSPELQDVAIRDYAAATGRTIVARLEGLDESGSRSASRWWARLDEACTMVEDGRVDVVLVWKFSRTARNRLRWAVALDRVEAAGGRLESATEQVDTTTSTGRFTRGMLAELNAFEAERIGEQWRETHAHRRARGLPHNGHPRLGYTYSTEHGYNVDPATAPVVSELYERYITGAGFRPLTTYLDGLGLAQPRTGRSWTVRGVAYFLASGFPAGLLSVHDPACRCGKPANCVRRTYIPGAHDPIIEPGVWAAYQRVRASRAATPARTLAPTTVLGGLVRCTSCEYAMRSKSDKRYGRAYLYVCETFGCTNPASATRERCEQAARAWLCRYAADVDTRADIAAAARADRATARLERDSYARQVLRLDQALTKLTKEYVMKVVPAGAYEAARDELTAERDAAAAMVEQYAEAVARPAPSRAAAVGVLSGWDVLPTVDLRRMLEPLLRVHVTRSRPGQAAVVVRPAWQ